MLDLVYTPEYVQAQLDKHNNRYNNHWKNHLYWAKKMVNDYYGNKPCTLLDLGCSVGTYAIEFALDGYETIGLDLDNKALEVAKQLAVKENVKPKWICANAGDFHLSDSVDIVLCFDLLEHLEDRVIEGLMKCVKENLKTNGIFLYHSFPTEYDHIFYKNLFFKKFTSIIPAPLIPFKNLNDVTFTSVVNYYSRFLDLFSLLTVGKTHEQLSKKTVHPNPLSKKRLDAFLVKAGFESNFSTHGIEEFNPLKYGQGKLAKRYFAEKTVTQRSLWGVTRISKQAI